MNAMFLSELFGQQLIVKLEAIKTATKPKSKNEKGASN